MDGHHPKEVTPGAVAAWGGAIIHVLTLGLSWIYGTEAGRQWRAASLRRRAARQHRWADYWSDRAERAEAEGRTDRARGLRRRASRARRRARQLDARADRLDP